MRRSVLGASLIATLAATAVLAPAAAQAAPCDGIGAQQPFLDWHDHASYVLVDGGDFETTTEGWTLAGGAAVTPGGNTLRPESSLSSLSLPSGSSATTPAICVAKGDPVARIFKRTVRSADRGQNSLKVQVIYLREDGSVRKVKKAGRLHEGREWNASRRFSIAQGQFHQGAKPSSEPKPETPAGPKPLETAQIQLRFTPLAGSAWQIDDVFVDPRRRL